MPRYTYNIITLLLCEFVMMSLICLLKILMSAQNNQISSCVTEMLTVPISLEVIIVSAIQDIMELGSHVQVKYVLE